MNITITKTTHPGTLPPSDQLGFGTVFTDHMFLMDYSADKGWHDARVVPYGPITMSPAASVLHYGTEVFEGMKAYPVYYTNHRAHETNHYLLSRILL